MDPAPREGTRRLVLVRHAKSDWPDDVGDHERPLAPRGRRDAPAVGRWLATHLPRPDLVLVSDARRTRETWELAAEAYQPRVEDVRQEPRAYAASVDTLLWLVRETPDPVRTLVLVGHNPGMQALAAALDDGRGDAHARTRMREKFPTSGIAVLEVRGDWADAAPRGCRLVDFAVPRG